MKALATYGLVAISTLNLFAGLRDTGTAVLDTVSQINALTDSEFDEHRPFSLSGLIIESSANIFFLQTADGNCRLFSPTNPPPPGSAVKVTGQTKLDRYDSAPILQATNWTVIAAATLPPAVNVDLKDVFTGRYDYRLIRTCGVVTGIFDDEVDHQWQYVILSHDGHHLPIACPLGTNNLAKLLNAQVAVSGYCCPRGTGRRHYLGCQIHASRTSPIEVIVPAPSDPFEAPPLGNLRSAPPESVAGLSRRSIRGRVLAVLENGVLVRTAAETTHEIKLIGNGITPEPGDEVLAAGMPETDLFHINLSHAQLRIIGKARCEPDEILDVPAERILFDGNGHRQVEPRFHGKVVRMHGIVRTVPSDTLSTINLECGHVIVPVDIFSIRNRLPDLRNGSDVEISGICRMDSDNWYPNRIFPQIRGFTIIPRTPNDIRILSLPSWWTHARLAAVILALSALTLILLCWNRMLTALIRRKGRALLKSEILQREALSRIDERSRIAAELHDSLSQDLTAISYRLVSAQNTQESNPAETRNGIATAVAMLRSSRTELRHCIWDLRSNALSETSFAGAIRKTLQPVVDMTRVSVKVDVPRSRIDDATTHAILRSIRELAINAFRHGQSTHVEVCGRIDGERLSFAISDDGCGFDTGNHPGPDQGHFGLDNIANRIERLNGSFEITSRPNQGSTAVITVPIQRQDKP